MWNYYASPSPRRCSRPKGYRKPRPEQAVDLRRIGQGSVHECLTGISLGRAGRIGTSSERSLDSFCSWDGTGVAADLDVSQQWQPQRVPDPRSEVLFPGGARRSDSWSPDGGSGSATESDPCPGLPASARVAGPRRAISRYRIFTTS